MNQIWPLSTMTFDGVERRWLWLVLLAIGSIALVAAYREMVRRSGRRLGWALLTLRAAGLLALVLALAKPTWTRDAEQVDPGRLAVIVDDSASMNLPAPGGSTRLADARKAVDQLRAAASDRRPGPGLAVDLFDLRGEPLADFPSRVEAGRTDLGRAVRSVAARLRSRPLAGLVLVSDGMDNTGRADFRDLADLPAPVHGLTFRNADTGAANLAIRSVQAPERALIRNQIKVDVRLSKSGGPATEAAVEVRRGKESLARESVALPVGNAERTVSLALTPDKAGRFALTASVAPAPGERRLDDNATSFPLRVDNEPIRVLYLEGFLRFEYKYLKERLEDDPDVRLASVVRRAQAGRAGETIGADMLTPERLKSVDVLILGDLEAADLDLAGVQSVVRWLDDAGHALLVLGGYHSFGPDGLRKTALADVLPVVFAEPGSPAQSEAPFALQLTDEGRRHPVFELSGDRVRDAATWAAAPTLSGTCLVQRAKPGATVLAVDPAVVTPDGPAVVAAVQRVGGGHAMVLAADTTWRWSRLTRVLGRSDTLFARFWGQAIRWLAGRNRDEARPPLVLSTDRPTYDAGQPVQVVATRQPRPDLDSSQSAPTVELIAPDGTATPVPLRSSSRQPDTFRGTITPTAGGSYELAGSLAVGGKPIANATAELLVLGRDQELADPGTNPAALRSIAALTGGRAVDVRDAATLAASLPRKERRTLRIERTELWDSPALFALFLGAVSAEWLLRRRNHLA